MITDNDENFQKHCIEKYEEYASSPNIQVFYDKDNAKRTFEIILYKYNTALCDDLYGEDAQNFMLKNKTEAAYRLLSQEQRISVPVYIRSAIEWIKQ